MKILLFGGTTEGRLLACALTQRGHQVTVSVATPMGAEALAGHFTGEVLTGRLDRQAMKTLLPAYDLCIDATHPYAQEVSRLLRETSTETGTPLRRLARQAGDPEGCIPVDSCAQAAEYLQDKAGNILLTTGSKELAAFAALAPDRLFPRVLPTHAGLDACLSLGIPHSNILALQGPFTKAMNQAMLEQYHIRWLVTKDGGSPGGFADKLTAAQAVGVPVLLVRRPPDWGERLEDLLNDSERGENPCK